jgi:nitrate/nitrite transporter NarK
MENSKKGWIVTFSGTGINLALGILYAWSVIKGGIPDSWGWSNADKALPYSVACLVFALTMVPSGKLQDSIGPRWVATMGGVLTGLGFIVAYFAGSSLIGFIIGFGVLGGAGFGFGYAATTPPAVKWFPPQKTGLIAGLVVAGFGLASVYIAPLATRLLTVYQTTTTNAAGQQVIEKGVSLTMLTFGIGFIIVVSILAQFISNPPEGYKPKAAINADGSVQVHHYGKDYSAKEMMSTPQFYILWLMFFAGSSAGLTFISVAQDLGKKSLGELAFVAVVVLSIGNASGRILAGLISDKIGRQWTLFGAFMIQACVVLALYFIVITGASFLQGWPVIMLVVAFIGANYGANLSLFPSAAKDFFGLKNYGMNYGLIFTSWGVAGLVMAWINGYFKDMGKPYLSYFLIIGILLTGAVLTFISRSMASKNEGKA